MRNIKPADSRMFGEKNGSCGDRVEIRLIQGCISKRKALDPNNGNKRAQLKIYDHCSLRETLL